MALPKTIEDREYKAFEECEGEPAKRTTVCGDVDVTGSLLTGVSFDSIGIAYPSTTTEVYTYFTGGLSGTLQATVTVTYTDSTKCELVSVVRT